VKELQITSHILNIFAEASGLVANLGKNEFYPIQCASVDLNFFTSRNIAVSSFPCKYLGLPLHFRKPTRAKMQPIIQKIAGRLPGWKRNIFTYPGRETLVKSVLSAIPTFFLTIFKMKKWAISRIDKFRRGFLWRGHDVENVKGGHCFVNWKTCLRPKKLGVRELKTLKKLVEPFASYGFGTARTLKRDLGRNSSRYLTLLIDNSSLPPLEFRLVMATTPHFGKPDGCKGAAPNELAPNLFKIAKFKSRSVSTELSINNWIRSLAAISNHSELEEFILLFMALSPVTLSDQHDQIFWVWTKDGKYSVASAYDCQFMGSYGKLPAPYVWKALTEPKSRFFTWLVLHDKVLTADNM
jgi:hypothetical protein